MTKIASEPIPAWPEKEFLSLNLDWTFKVIYWSVHYFTLGVSHLPYIKVWLLEVADHGVSKTKGLLPREAKSCCREYGVCRLQFTTAVTKSLIHSFIHSFIMIIYVTGEPRPPPDRCPAVRRGTVTVQIIDLFRTTCYLYHMKWISVFPAISFWRSRKFQLYRYKPSLEHVCDYRLANRSGMSLLMLLAIAFFPKSSIFAVWVSVSENRVVYDIQQRGILRLALDISFRSLAYENNHGIHLLHVTSWTGCSITCARSNYPDLTSVRDVSVGFTLVVY